MRRYRATVTMLPAKLNRLLILACALCMLAIFLQPIECLFKLVKKKKFMEGFLVGFLVGNEYAAHKGPPKGAGVYPGPMPHYAPMGKPMEFDGEGISHGHFDQYPYMPKKSDRSYRIRRRKAKKRRSKARIKKIVKLPVYVQKSN